MIVLRLALDQLLRYRLRTILTGLGLALAMAVVVFANVIGFSVEGGTSGLYHYLRTFSSPDPALTSKAPILTSKATVWLTPGGGVQLDPETGFLLTAQDLAESWADRVLQEAPGNKVLVQTLFPPSLPEPVIVIGRSDLTRIRSTQRLHQLWGRQVQLNQHTVSVDDVDLPPELGSRLVLEMPLALAQGITQHSDRISWLMVKPENMTDFRRFLAAQPQISVTTDPAFQSSTLQSSTLQSTPLQFNAFQPTSSEVIAYLLDTKLSRSDLVSFDVKFAALYFNQVGTTALGWIGRLSLGLGFLLMLTSSWLTVEERRGEFAVFAALGISGDLFYLFLLEALIVLGGSTLLGIGLGAGLLATLVPSLLPGSAFWKAAALIVCYLPPLIIMGALVPGQRLLQQSPLELWRESDP